MVKINLACYFQGDTGIEKTSEVAFQKGIEINPMLLVDKAEGEASTLLAVEKVIRELQEQSKEIAERLHPELSRLPKVERLRIPTR